MAAPWHTPSSSSAPFWGNAVSATASTKANQAAGCSRRRRPATSTRRGCSSSRPCAGCSITPRSAYKTGTIRPHEEIIMKPVLTVLMLLWLGLIAPVQAAGKWVATPYAPAKVVFEFYLDDPQKVGSALYWVRSLMNPLMDAPYNYSPEDLNIVVVIHGTEIVTVAKKNEAKYQDAVDRMRYYDDLG